MFCYKVPEYLKKETLFLFPKPWNKSVLEIISSRVPVLCLIWPGGKRNVKTCLKPQFCFAVIFWIQVGFSLQIWEENCFTLAYLSLFINQENTWRVCLICSSGFISFFFGGIPTEPKIHYLQSSNNGNSFGACQINKRIVLKPLLTVCRLLLARCLSPVIT